MKLINLERERRNKGWTQEDASEKAGVARSTYANWENGKREPDFETSQRLANIFGVTVDYLRGQSKFRNADELAEKYIELESKSKTSQSANEQSASKMPYVAYLGGPPEEIDEDEAEHLKKELEMYRAFQEKIKRERDQKDS